MNNIPENISPMIRNRIEHELLHEEKLIWMGLPTPQYFTLKAKDSFSSGILMTAFMIFWMTAGGVGVSHTSLGIYGGILFALCGLPFLLIGLYMLSTPLWTYKKLKKTVYAITNNRALIIELGWSVKTSAYTPQDLTKISREEKSGGTGNILFASIAHFDVDGDYYPEHIYFYGIKESELVEGLLNNLKVTGQVAIKKMSY